MQNVVSLQSDRPRPQRALGVPRSGARILFFTGVRYCREDRDEADRLTLIDEDLGGGRAAAPRLALDVTAH